MFRTLCLLLVSLCLALSAGAQTKRALIVGVGDYDELPDLQKTTGDANGYADVFRDNLGFEVTLVTDVKTVEFLEALDGFLKSISPGDEVAFIFSGHGWSDGADNFLALKDAPLEGSEFALKHQTVSLLNEVLAEIRARRPGVLFAIIDACRDNPFSTGTRSVTRGMVRQDVVPGTMIVYAAGALQKALDRLGPDDASPYSVFTRTLLPKLRNPSTPLQYAVNSARDEVGDLARTIEHEQRPAVYSDVDENFCFAERCDVRTVLDQETQDWLYISSDGYTGVDVCTKYSNHLEKYPEGKFAARASSALANPPCAALRMRLKQVRWYADLNGHEDDVFGVDYSPSGRFAASASNDRTVRIWVVGMSPSEFGELSVLEGHEALVNTVRFSPDEERAVSASDDGTARIWRTVGGEAVHVLRGHEDGVNYAEYSPDGSQIVTAGADKTIRLWDAATGEQLRVIRGHDGAVRSARFSPDGSYILSAGNDGLVQVWNPRTGEKVRTVENNGFPATYATYSQDGTAIAVASWDKTARIWREGEDAPLKLTGHDAYLWNVSFSPDGELVATSAGDLAARVWDARNGAELARVQSIGNGGSNWIEFSPDGKELITSLQAGSAVQLWELEFEPDTPAP
ncbi:MAG: caspase family protein [Hyphomonas sp.]|nr:caspase family protein [Hyphomonas sp.]